MITLDPEIVGSFNSQKSQVTPEGALETPFSRLSRVDKLRVQGNLDETGDAEAQSEDEDGGKKGSQPRERKEKSKMRGRNKSMKKLVSSVQPLQFKANIIFRRYLKKKLKKNVIDPKTVSNLFEVLALN